MNGDHLWVERLGLYLPPDVTPSPGIHIPETISQLIKTSWSQVFLEDSSQLLKLLSWPTVCWDGP